MFSFLSACHVRRWTTALVRAAFCDCISVFRSFLVDVGGRCLDMFGPWPWAGLVGIPRGLLALDGRTLADLKMALAARGPVQSYSPAVEV